MTNDEVLQAVLEWALEAIPALQGAYDHEPSAKTSALPDLVAVLQGESVRRTDDEFPIMALQQVGVRRLDFELSFMVEAGVTPEEAGASQAQLRAFAEAVTAAVLADETLGGRVMAAAPTSLAFDYERPFVEYEDATRGREMRCALSIAEALVME